MQGGDPREPAAASGVTGGAATETVAPDPARPLRTLGNVVVGLLALVTIANLLALWADLIQLDLLTDVRDRERVGLQELRQSDDRVATTALFQTGAYLACTIAFLIWYGRAYRNVERLGARGLRWGKRWAIAYWFIPIANLFRPKQVMNDIWRASDPDLPATAYGWQDNRVPQLVHWWWGLWILSSFVINFLIRGAFDQGNTPDELVSLTQRFIALDVVDVVPTILAILVVRATTARQERRRMAHEGGELAEVQQSPADDQVGELAERRWESPQAEREGGTPPPHR